MPKPALIMSVKDSLRLHSVRLHIALAVALTYLLQVPDAALPLLNALPPELRAKLPWLLGPALVALGVYARLKPQPAVTGDGH